MLKEEKLESLKNIRIYLKEIGIQERRIYLKEGIQEIGIYLKEGIQEIGIYLKERIISKNN